MHRRDPDPDLSGNRPKGLALLSQGVDLGLDQAADRGSPDLMPVSLGLDEAGADRAAARGHGPADPGGLMAQEVLLDWCSETKSRRLKNG
jgi:hypothetical protein